jgi:RNA polymerase sigma factor (sigma-70 family)
MLTSTELRRVARQLRLTAEAQQRDPAAAAELLERFQAGGDREAFEAIVWRFGPGVLSACRKVLSSAADVEDVFQATFVILLRKARTIRRREALGAWLAGVAHRLALKALTASARRQRAEQRTCRGCDARAAEAPDLSWREACAILHEELDKLPDRYRLPLILCYLEGKGREEAAQQLGVNVGVLRGRLDRGRERLRVRLIKRGIALSAVLLAVVANSVTAGGPPQHLLRATVEAAMTGRLSANVAALLHGATPPMTLSKCKLLAVAALVIGLLSAGAGLSMFGAPAEARAVPEAAPEKKAAEPGKDAGEKDQGTIKVAGRVLNPDDTPAAGAKVYVLGSKRTKAEAVATADAEGKFEFVVKGEEVGHNGRLLATGEDHAPDWVDLARCAQGAVTLRLHKDDVPFTGRVVTLEGQPVAGATVEAERIGKQAEGDDLKPWLDENVRLRKESIWLNERQLVTVTPAAFGKQLTATTDKDGKFRLTGAGRDRVLSLRVTGPGLEHKFFWVVTRPEAPKDGYFKTHDFNYGLYGAEVTVLLAPSKPLVGTVRDRKTDKPIAGITVQEVRHYVSKAVTDEQGRYRLEGVPKTAQYTLTAYGKKGVPYFDNAQMDVRDTAGFDPITVDFKMYRGVEVTGRVTDKATGKPVAARVMYFQSFDNPVVKNDPPPNSVFVYSNWGGTDPDGRYSVLALPGSGAVVVTVNAADAYPVVDAQVELRKWKTRGGPTRAAHSVFGVDPDETKPESLVRDVELTAGKSRKATVLGPDDKPLEGVHAFGLVPYEELPQTMKSHAFTLTGLGERKRILVFLHPEKKLGGVTVVSGDSEDAVTVKLQPLGTVEGTVLDADGKPWAGLRVKVTPAEPREDYDNLGYQQRDIQGNFSIYRGLPKKFLTRDMTTDKEGRFRVDGVLPGVDFDVYVGDGDLSRQGTLVVSKNRVRVEAGKANDLGVLKKDDGKGNE